MSFFIGNHTNTKMFYLRACLQSAFNGKKRDFFLGNFSETEANLSKVCAGRKKFPGE